MAAEQPRGQAESDNRDCVKGHTARYIYNQAADRRKRRRGGRAPPMYNLGIAHPSILGMMHHQMPGLNILWSDKILTFEHPYRRTSFSSIAISRSAISVPARVRFFGLR